MRRLGGCVAGVLACASLALAGCGGGGSTGGGGGQQPTTPTVTVSPATSSITTTQSLQVMVTVSGGAGSATPTGSVTLSGGGYTSSAATLSGGSATITIPANALAAGSDKLTGAYTPDSASSSTYNSASGSATVTVNALVAPTVTVTPALSTITVAQKLQVTVTVAGGAGTSTPTGSVMLSGGGYTSAATTLSNGSASITIPPNQIGAGAKVQLTATYTPDSQSSGAYLSATGTANVTVNPLLTPTVTVSPASNSITTGDSLNVKVTVAGGTGNPTPSGSVMLSGGGYTSSATPLDSSGSASITIPANKLATGSDTLTASYTAAKTDVNYTNASGTATVTVSGLATPTVTVSPASNSINTSQSLSVKVTVAGGSGNPTPTGSVVLASGTYTSAAETLASGSATVNVPGGSLAAGSDTLTATYTPDSQSSGVYASATGKSSAVTVLQATTVAVDQKSTGVATTDQILGMNLATWYDVSSNAPGINTAFGQAGIKAIRWPGGSWSDIYHWGDGNVAPFTCAQASNGSWRATGWGGWDTFSEFETSIVQGGGYDLALTANYGSNEACTGGGDPAEAADWAAQAVKNGFPASHMTVGNENYGSWETDLHAKPWDPATYANSVIGPSGYYALIKKASPKTLVGVVADAGSIQASWDSTVLSTDKGSYDFVEFHYYPQNPGGENDTYLVHQAALDFTNNINALKTELNTAGEKNTPIYVGEMGSVSSNPGKQSWSITQGLYAGQLLGEMMNDGISRGTWWIGFGNCNGDEGLFNSSLYGWQDFGAYNVFADGPGDTGGSNNSPCSYGGAIGTMNPTARAYQLFSNVAVSGESVLAATVTGDTSDVRAYAATHSGGTALVLFNLNETASQSVTVNLSVETSSPDVKVITYDKSIYDQTDAATPVWAPPATTDMSKQSLPLTLTLTPWSMNVVIIK